MVSIALLIAMVFLSATVQSLLGFGFGMVLMALVPLLMDLKQAIPLVSFICLMMNSSLLVYLRRDAARQKFGPLVLGAVIGVPCGVLFLRSAPEAVLMLCLGLVIVAFVVRSFVDLGRTRAELGVGWGYVAGFAGGALGGAFNTGGAPPVMYAARKPWSPDAVKANLQVFFVWCSALQVAIFLSSGMLTWDVVRSDLVAIPGILGGIWMGTRLSRGLDSEKFQWLVLGGLGLMGLVYLYRGGIAL